MERPVVAAERAVQAAYDAVADTYADFYTATEGEQPEDLAMIDRFCAAVRGPRRVLDAGCGAGRLLPYLAARGCNPAGVDLSAGMIRRARSDHPGFPTAVASLTALPFPDATFDGVFAWYSLIHTPDASLPPIVAELRRVLTPGGVLLVAFQAGEGVRDIGAAFGPYGHDVTLLRHHRSAASMERMLAAEGFVPLDRLERPPVAGEREDQVVLIVEVPAPADLAAPERRIAAAATRGAVGQDGTHG
ncbi:methyltransferase domain-containing protein [Propioniciclava soli]|uniref:Methyltransferase domain-containing protein n=1 Tax=Propioniciclava soli TaxID=2775081 RepID=A0ABZ3C633_9ACTN